MRSVSIVALALAAILVSGCITFSAEPTPTPSQAPTEIPMITPAPTPVPTPTREPTPTLAPGQTPLPTPMDLRPFLTSGVTLYNLGDSPLFVTATGIDPDSGDEFQLGEFQVAPDQFTRQAAIPLLLRFDFTFEQGNVAALGSCTMIVASEDEIEFLAAAGGVVVVKNAGQPEALSELDVATSSLCATGGGE